MPTKHDTIIQIGCAQNALLGACDAFAEVAIMMHAVEPDDTDDWKDFREAYPRTIDIIGKIQRMLTDLNVIFQDRLDATRAAIEKPG